MACVSTSTATATVYADTTNYYGDLLLLLLLLLLLRLLRLLLLLLLLLLPLPLLLSSRLRKHQNHTTSCKD